MATYADIQNYVKTKYGFSVKPCWIADMKQKSGLRLRISSRSVTIATRKHPCPKDKERYVLEAFRYFNIL